ncbi:MAG: hypothetical protein FWE30_04615 [Bacteroidales bacterium]|nr:hypothetical protein [Bacteroidales bacterium]MCL2738710.1 hypothetical protein [Bacteroidales bacterium]
MDFTAVIIVPAIFYFVYKIFEALIRRRERILMIEKLDFSNLQTLPSAEAFNVLDYMPNKRFSGLRAGLLLAGMGIGLITAWGLTVALYPTIASLKTGLGGDFYNFRNMFQAIYLAAPACFGGIGLIISYIIEQKARK